MNKNNLEMYAAVILSTKENELSRRYKVILKQLFGE